MVVTTYFVFYPMLVFTLPVSSWSRCLPMVEKVLDVSIAPLEWLDSNSVPYGEFINWLEDLAR